jgi:hypothetical protein
MTKDLRRTEYLDSRWIDLLFCCKKVQVSWISRTRYGHSQGIKIWRDSSKISTLTVAVELTFYGARVNFLVLINQPSLTCGLTLGFANKEKAVLNFEWSNQFQQQQNSHHTLYFDTRRYSLSKLQHGIYCFDVGLIDLFFCCSKVWLQSRNLTTYYTVHT